MHTIHSSSWPNLSGCLTLNEGENNFWIIKFGNPYHPNLPSNGVELSKLEESPEYTMWYWELVRDVNKLIAKMAYSGTCGIIIITIDLNISESNNSIYQVYPIELLNSGSKILVLLTPPDLAFELLGKDPDNKRYRKFIPVRALATFENDTIYIHLPEGLENFEDYLKELKQFIGGISPKISVIENPNPEGDKMTNISTYWPALEVKL